MNTLFVRLYCMLMLGFLVIFTVGTPRIVENALIDDSFSDVAQLNYALINRELPNADIDEWRTYIDKRANEYGFQLAILAIDDIPVSRADKARLWNHEIVFDELNRRVTGRLEIDRFFNTWSSMRRINDSDYALLMAWETTEIENYRRLLQWFVFFVRKHLSLANQSEWPAIIDRIQLETGKAIHLLDANDKQFLPYREPLLAGDIISYPDNDDIIVHFQPVASIPYVVAIGPVGVGDTDPGMLIYYFVFSSLVFSAVLLLFLWPLWRELKLLAGVTAAFGGGSLDARISIRKRSSIAGVIKTFNAMADRVGRLLKSQKELVNAVSHELRTPISSLRFGMEAVADSDDGLVG